ncbi:hypothetical protein [Novosphingobium pentaromativorans]|nr:hypothetical protein [Novosphingobium pentaromativorans]
MAKPIPLRFSVMPENEAAAVDYLQEQGYSPTTIEKDESGVVILIFRPLPDNQLIGLFQALPMHLSAKTGIVMGDQPSIT